MDVVFSNRFDRVSCVVNFDKKDKNSVSMTCQADMDSADVNKIMDRFSRSGNIQDLAGNLRQPRYGDFTGVGDYYSMLSALRRVESAFGVLEAKIRNRFDNDPGKLIAFLNDPANEEEAVKIFGKEGFFVGDKGAADTSAAGAGAGAGNSEEETGGSGNSSGEVKA